MRGHRRIPQAGRGCGNLAQAAESFSGVMSARVYFSLTFGIHGEGPGARFSMAFISRTRLTKS